MNAKHLALAMRKFLAAVVLLALPLTAIAANPAYVGTTPGDYNSTTGRTPSCGCATDDFIIILLTSGGTPASPTVSDTQGTVITDFAFSGSIGVYRVHDATDVSHKISVSWETAPTDYYLTIVEASGIGSVDTSAGAPGINSGNNVNPTTGNLTASSGDLLLAATTSGRYQSSGYSTWTNGFTGAGSDRSGPSWAVAYLNSAAAGGIDTQTTIATATSWNALLIAYEGGTGGFFPAGHWIASPTGQSLTQVFPQPDAVTPTTARQHWAYWDGTHDIPYDVAIGVSFGAYPYVCTLSSGPPGMTIGQTYYNGFQNKNYCRVLWHPQGNISSNWSGTVSVLITDQQHNTLTVSWTLETDDTATHFVFVSTTGSGSSCTYSAPCTFSTAFGATYSATSFPGAICYVFGGSYTGATNLPAYTDTGKTGFTTNVVAKPNALIGIPGQSVILDASAGGTLIQVGSADWYMENITANGYDTSAVDRLIMLGQRSRLTFDQVNWTNSGYGTGKSNNMSMFVSGGVQSPSQYLFITDSEESNRETGVVGNNGGFCDLYSYDYALIQRSVENSPSSHLDWVFLYKSDIQNSELRENYADVAGTSDGGFGYGQTQYSGAGNDETAYNLGINVNKIWGNGAPNYTWQAIGIYRNTLVAGTGPGIVVTELTYNLEGPGDGTTSGPPSVASSAAAGSLTASTEYTWGITSLGVTGESATIIGSNGNAESGIGGGESNRVSFTLGATNTAATLSWLPEPGALGYMGYRELTSCGGGTGCWTQYSLGNVTSWTDTGAAGSTTSPPTSPGTAISAARWSLYSNALSTTASGAIPTGATIQTDSNNLVDPSNPCTTPATTCLLQTNGQLNPTYVPGSLPPYSTVIGKVGYQIQ